VIVGSSEAYARISTNQHLQNRDVFEFALESKMKADQYFAIRIEGEFKSSSY